MIEIRPIREPEAETFLGLLCGVFDLDFARARSIFFTEPLFDLNRKWALFEKDRMVSILTTVPLEFGWGRAIGIAGVATALERQGEGFAAKLLTQVMKASAENGEPGVMLFAQDRRLYERVGFEILDNVIRGAMIARPEDEIPEGIGFDQVKAIYDAWSCGNPNRLRRDPLRWQYWKWNMRVSTAFHDGYLCFEGGIVREVVIGEPASDWVLPLETEWLGLASMASRLGVQVASPEIELHLLGCNIPALPEFYMTDQF